MAVQFHRASCGQLIVDLGLCPMYLNWWQPDLLAVELKTNDRKVS